MVNVATSYGITELPAMSYSYPIRKQVYVLATVKRLTQGASTACATSVSSIPA